MIRYKHSNCTPKMSSSYQFTKVVSNLFNIAWMLKITNIIKSWYFLYARWYEKYEKMHQMLLMKEKERYPRKCRQELVLDSKHLMAIYLCWYYVLFFWPPPVHPQGRVNTKILKKNSLVQKIFTASTDFFRHLPASRFWQELEGEGGICIIYTVILKLEE